MNQWIREAWRRPRARMTGALYLLYFLTAILAQFLVNTKDERHKAQIASALIGLGDKENIYWDFLLRQAISAL